MLKNRKIITLASLGALLCYGTLQANVSTTGHATVENPSTTNNDKLEKVDMKKLSEALGNSIGRSLESMPSIHYDVDSLIKGIRDGAAGKPSPLSEKEAEEMMMIVQEKAFKEQSEVNLKAANEFIEKNKNDKTVKEIVPGKLQYTVLKEGTGAVVEPHSSPKIHYTGKYQNGTVFGTSEEMGGPITIPLDQTIPGFSKGITGMKEGEKRRLFIHPDLGFGTASQQLQPNELIIFDVEVIKANSDDLKDKMGGKLNGAAGLNDDDEDDDDDDDDDFYFEEDEEELTPGNPSSTGSKSLSDNYYK
ncbi:MAG: FKBP-type peptidyl-prolyl cis-trans isomerase [Parachlamydiaceae bacterium]|nr:FKBP-type peptidyl-prolyl cis-trans isomerase [Parachlamydiaceae bacterium]